MACRCSADAARPADGSALPHRNGAEFCAVPPGDAPMGILAVVQTSALGGPGHLRSQPERTTRTSSCSSQRSAIAAGLLTLITSVVLIDGSGDWRGEVDATQLTNAVLLCLGVGFAEELIFRSWLWTELHQRMGSRPAALAQAGVFSLVHTRFNLGLGAMSGLLIGLFLLGMVLARQRQSDRGSLWGCIGLHGGLVAGWFLLQNGLLQLSPDTPPWLVGPGGNSPNPLGGLVGISSLLILLLFQRTAVAKAALPATGARNAS